MEEREGLTPEGTSVDEDFPEAGIKTAGGVARGNCWISLRVAGILLAEVLLGAGDGDQDLRLDLGSEGDC
jgi:hypothetical protein